MNKTTVGDIEIAYRQSGSGAPVILVHGLGEDGSSFASLQAHLAGCTTYAVDLRGHGGSSNGNPEGTLDQLAGDLIGFLETVTGPAQCLGFSMGGTVALAAALERPELFREPLVVAGTSSVVGRAAVGFFSGRIALIESGALDEFRTGLEEDNRLQFVTDTDTAPVLARRIAAIGQGAGYVNGARAMMGVHDQPLTQQLAGLSKRVEVIGGDGDVFCPRKAADIMIEALPNATYHELQMAGHQMICEQADAFNALVASLLGCEAP